VLGASGCGKSTLLRAIAGLDREHVGSITINGQGTVGVVYQEPRLMPWLTVEQNIAFGLEAKTSIAPNSPIDALLQEVMLEDARHYWPKQLSGGMAQRVSIARALAREPEVLLMDEPFSALDVLTRRSLHQLTREVTAKHQTATLIVTHDPDEAVSLADRVIVLAKKSNSEGATIVRDVRPSKNADEKHREVEAIIAALDSLSSRSVSEKTAA
jgi:sulfonate transport system ATP-binding protein